MTTGRLCGKYSQLLLTYDIQPDPVTALLIDLVLGQAPEPASVVTGHPGNVN